MSFFFGDGFDLYTQPADMAASYWDTNSPATQSGGFVAGRFSGSRANQIGGAPNLYKTSNVNDAVHHFTFAYMQNGNTTSSNAGFYITLWDGATAQCSMSIRGDGFIQLMSGDRGTVLAAWAGQPLAGNVWYAFEIELVVHNTNGSMTIRKNGNSNNDYYSGLFNTRGSANNYANKMSVGYWQGIGATIYIDDFLWRSEASTVPWSGDIRCYTRRPTSDVGTPQWSRTSGSVNALMWNPVGVNQQFPANNALYMQVTVPYSGLMTGLALPTIATANGTGRIKGALFSNINNTVGSILAVSSEINNPGTSTGAPITLSFPTPAYVTAGQTYWIGINNDSGNIGLNVINSPAPNISLSIPYTSWPTANPGGTIAGNNMPGLSLIFASQSNSDSVGELYQDQTVNYVYSSTNGQNDLYTIGSISVTPAQVLGVTTRGYFEKSDSGTRNATVQLKSGGTTVQGADTALTTATWNWIYRNDLTDPATGAAWTATAVNGVTIGPRITA